ncbi:hypothetical protein [Mameliella sediminis]|uniref:hypothetical protein n=1 Tax=Mameliella sediminis TaxID=2836866 RepID=UPI001C44B2E1|nr:hypothetical protein [Mameliella sediminis]MBY6114291.1 hypothetical protein [Antarctobacter heliothermus]MBY6143864.1 hypothetical protein [Mameliella alba]MBV7393228.1 hypothetical protein [Mameliella sediminis]MBY6163300.1 hypothetical protein [Mameliella alba]MBY6171563.1 hypothetical protein [Mameliella alba]
MGLKRLAEKMAAYKARLQKGKARKIKSGHVEKILHKLRKKSEELERELAAADSGSAKARLSRKLDIARVQIERGEWLLKQVD